MKANKRARRDAKRLYRLCVVDGLLDAARAREVVRRVAESGHRRRLAVLAVFRRLVKLDRERHTALVHSAVPLADDLRTAIERGLGRRYGPGLDTAFADDPALIGGVRIRVASDVYDGTIKGALSELEARF